jgi:glyoxylate reductase
MSEPVLAITRLIPEVPVIPGVRVKSVAGPRAMARGEMLEFVSGAAVVITWVSEKVDASFLDACGPQLLGVCNFAVGVDNIDLAECKKRGVIVANTPHAVTEGTANMAWALLLAVARRLVKADRYARSAAFASEGPLGPAEFLGMDITGKNLLIVGAGRIGFATALRGIGFGMRTLYVARSRHLDFEMAPLCARRVTLEEGLREADVVSVHTPLTGETRHLLNSRTIAMMKPTAILLNTARGPIVDEAALVDALVHNRIFGAGLDVFEHEPKVHPGLVGLENVVLSPHIGSGESKYRRLMSEMAIGNAMAILCGAVPAYQVV